MRYLQSIKRRYANCIGLQRCQNYSCKSAITLARAQFVAFWTMIITRTGRPLLFTPQQLDNVIEYCAENYEHRCMKWEDIIRELKLPIKENTLMRRMHERGYYRCVTCQKPYLTLTQVNARLIWAIDHVFWYAEWLKVLWSDECTFLIGGRSAKERVTRKQGERECPTCIQHQFHRAVQLQ